MDVNAELTQARKGLKPQAFFHCLTHRNISCLLILCSRYWFKRSKIAQNLQRRNKLSQRTSIRESCPSTQGDESTWLKTSRAEKSLKEMKTQVWDPTL